MKIQKQRKKRNRKLLIACLAGLVILAGAGVYYFVIVRSDDAAIDSGKSDSATKKPTKEEQESQATIDRDKKQEYLDNEQDASGPPAQTSSADDISIDIKQDGSKIIVSTNLGYISSGKCKLTVGSYSSTVDVLYQPDYSTCRGFTIDKSQLQTGVNTFKLEVSYGNTTLTKTQEADIK